MLDGVEDPFNFGQAVRALYAAGVDAVVVRRPRETALATVTRCLGGRNRAPADGDRRLGGACGRPVTSRRPAGGVCGESALGDRPHEADLTGGLFVLIGGERRGVTRSFIDEADVQLRIGYGARAPRSLVRPRRPRSSPSRRLAAATRGRRKPRRRGGRRLRAAFGPLRAGTARRRHTRCRIAARRGTYRAAVSARMPEAAASRPMSLPTLVPPTATRAPTLSAPKLIDHGDCRMPAAYSGSCGRR